MDLSKFRLSDATNVIWTRAIAAVPSRQQKGIIDAVGLIMAEATKEAVRQSQAQADLVYLSNEDFPRLRTCGRLVWLGPHGAAQNYHDPEVDYETFSKGPGPEDGTEDVRDQGRWCPPLPEGVYIARQLAL